MPQPDFADVPLRIVVTTFADESSASQVIHELIRKRLIACGTMIPGCRSIYVWEAKVHDTEEIIVHLKCPADRVDEVERALHALHPYEVPEFVVLAPEAVSQAYGDWGSTAPDSLA